MQNVTLCLKEPYKGGGLQRGQHVCACVRVCVCVCVCVSVRDTAVIVSLSWLVQRRGAEVPVAPKLSWEWCR